MCKFLTVLLFSISAFAQKNVLVEYNAKIAPLEKQYKIPNLKEAFEYAMNNDDKLSFELLITKEGSKFKDISGMGSSESTYLDKILLSFSGYLGEVYNIKDDVYSHLPMMNSNTYKKTNKISGWKLTSETKEIDGYLCYKATNIKTVVNSVKTFEHPVTAWYCPKLPYSFGPNGYGNLPGLILELQVRNVVFGAKKIDLNSKLDFDMEFLKKAKIKTEEEINATIQKDFEAMQTK